MRAAAIGVGLFTMLLSGCGFGHRHLKIVAPEHVVFDGRDRRPAVILEAEDRHGVRRALTHPVMEDRSGRTLLRPAVITGSDTLIVTPAHADAEIRLWIQSTGWLGRRNLVQVRTVAGSLRRRFANEVRFLPVDEPLLHPFELEIRKLANPYNPYNLFDGDLVVLEALDVDGQRQRTLLVHRDVGVHFGGFAGALITVPTGGETRTVAPILAAGPTFGFRTRKAHGPARILDTVELVVSFGIGSTTFTDVVVDGEQPEISGVFNAGLAGGGVRVFQVLTVQGFVNTNAFFREELEAPATLAVGLDATGLARLLRDAGSRLFFEHPIEDRKKKKPPQE